MKKVFRKMKKRLSGDGAEKKKSELESNSQSSVQDGSTSSERIKEVAPKTLSSSAVARQPTITEETSTDDTASGPGKGKSGSSSPKRARSPKGSFSPLRSKSPKNKKDSKKDAKPEGKKDAPKKAAPKKAAEPPKKKEEEKKPVDNKKDDGKDGKNSNSSNNSGNANAVDRSSQKKGDRKEGTPDAIKTYSDVPTLETTKLPRGGISIDTKAVGRIQFGIPPETIKDSMTLGLPVPQVYIVPVERFCREMGPALGVNLAEFEFPAYFNFFVYKKRCTLVVDSADAEQNIRRVFSETLLGPEQFRKEENPIDHELEDFSTDFDRDAIPNFQKELKHFRIMPDGSELILETLLDFRHFNTPVENVGHENLGVIRASKDSEKEGVEDDSDTDENEATEDVPSNARGVEKRGKTPWNYDQARWQGDVSTVWPPTATPEQIAARNVPRVEIFKMPGGTEYIVHDIDKNNFIIGKNRFSGHVKVSEQMSVEGFGGQAILDPDDVDSDDSLDGGTRKQELPRTFHPPSFGVTVLGNSHGFDKSGSVSGYVLWINGRGVMIDPPPYSSATLEREGIRPRMIVGIIITHCHADHDAGAFQKVLTGSPVVVITTPTIYKSFIRKYAALSALSPALLRHSHRYKPAIIGQPLRFQGATFHFTYTLHTIPCIGFRVEWRGRSMVFTGDHLNSPPDIDRLEKTGILSHARAEDLRQLPLQETDLLLHEAGAPPIHTPLEVLMKLPSRVKRRMYVVHTAALPEGCELRVAPTGTAGTIRLDQLQKSRTRLADRGMSHRNWGDADTGPSTMEEEQDMPSAWSGANSEYDSSSVQSFDEEHALTRAAAAQDFSTSFANLAQQNPSGKKSRANSMFASDSMAHIPLVSLRPASSTDAWFILNLLSAVPFLSSLSYASTMEVLETCRVDAYCVNDVVVPIARRKQILCVVWEGTCAERPKQTTTTPARGSYALPPIGEADVNDGLVGAVWYAGDWTGPIALQPERRLSGESELSPTHDVVAISAEGVKVITIEISHLHPILKSGSPLYRKYLDRRAQQERAQSLEMIEGDHMSATEQLLGEALRTLNILDLLNCNSALRKLSAVQKRHLESLAEGPVSFLPGERIWRSGAPVDKAFIIVSGTASFVPRRRNAGSANVPNTSHGKFRSGEESKANCSIGEEMAQDALKAIKELGTNNTSDKHDEESSASSVDSRKYDHVLQFDSIFSKVGGGDSVSSHAGDDDFGKLSRDLQRHAENMVRGGGTSTNSIGGSSADTSDLNDGESADEDYGDNDDGENRGRRTHLVRRRSSKARFANKVLGRLYSRRAFTHGLIFSRGHFLGDVSKMVAGVLSSDVSSELGDDSSPSYGFGEMSESGEHGRRISQTREISLSVAEMVIHEQGNHNIMHSSTLTAGKEGCVVLVFPKSSFGPFLDEYPGLLLSLLGTQVVV